MHYSLLGSFVGILILLSLIRPVLYGRDLKMIKGKARPSIIPPKGIVAEFHQAEFVSLKAEIAELLKSVASNFQYAALGSAGVITWVVTPTSVSKLDKSALVVGLWIPFSLTCFLLSLSVAQYIRISEIGAYLWRLEGAFSSSELGWEEFFSKRERSVGWSYGIGWTILLIVDAVIGCIGPTLLISQ